VIINTKWEYKWNIKDPTDSWSVITYSITPRGPPFLAYFWRSYWSSWCDHIIPPLLSFMPGFREWSGTSTHTRSIRSCFRFAETAIQTRYSLFPNMATFSIYIIVWSSHKCWECSWNGASLYGDCTHHRSSELGL